MKSWLLFNLGPTGDKGETGDEGEVIVMKGILASLNNLLILETLEQNGLDNLFFYFAFYNFYFQMILTIM